LINSSLDQAKQAGIRSVVIYGGEPFLRIHDLLPMTLNKALEKNLPVSIGTNGFWGRTEKQAKIVLSDLEEITAKHNGFVSIGISVDKYHQPKIPPESIANIIKQHRMGNFPHIRLGIQSFQDQESFDAVGQVFGACWRNDICLIESNDFGYIYPALANEFIEYKEENFPLISKKLELEEDAGDEEITTCLANLLRVFKDMRDIITPSVIARNIDLGNGQKNYLVFPNPNYMIDQIREKKVINAGRAKKGNNLELQLYPEKKVFDHLIIAPNGQAYAYPAQITEQEGIPANDNNLQDVIIMVGNRLENTP
jgi:hypothetical protein